MTVPNSIVQVYSKTIREPGDGEYKATFAVHWNGERFVTMEVSENTRVNASSYLFEIFEAYLCGLHFKTAEEHENLPHKGDVVRVAKSRGRAKMGTEGTIFWTIENRYGTLCGIRTSDRKNEKGRWRDKAWAYSDNLVRLNPWTGLPMEPYQNRTGASL